MKRLGVVLLALGLVFGFSMSAFAVGGADVKFSGEWYARGYYFNNPQLKGEGANGGSFSYYDGYVRFVTDYKIAQGITLTTRFDAMETIAGADRKVYVVDATGAKPDKGSDEQNISVERAYITFDTGIGTFRVGQYGVQTWGTPFWDNSSSKPGIKWTRKQGPFELSAQFWRSTEGNLNPDNTPKYQASDVDRDVYDLAARYMGKGLEAGLQWEFHRDARNRLSNTTGYTRALHIISPYVITKLGPVNVDAEAYYITGDWKKMESGVGDVKAESLGAYVKGTVNLGKAWVGGMLMYMQGDDPATTDKQEGTILSALNYCDDKGDNFFGILWGDNYHSYNKTNTQGTASKILTQNYDNLIMYQLLGGYQFTDKLSMKARALIMKAETSPNVKDVSDDMGKEVGASIYYKIYDNLTYSLQGHYLWTGDYFKGTNNATNLANEYFIQHALTLAF